LTCIALPSWYRPCVPVVSKIWISLNILFPIRTVWMFYLCVSYTYSIDALFFICISYTVSIDVLHMVAEQ